MSKSFAPFAALVGLSLALGWCWPGMVGCARAARDGFQSPTPDGRLRAIAAAMESKDDSPATLRQLVVSLGSDDALERLLAIYALKHITGETHGYRHFDDIRARQEATNRWIIWLQRQGLAEGPIVLWNVTPQPHRPPPGRAGSDLIMSESFPHIRFEMLSQARYLSSARAMAAAVAERYGFDECACGQIALVVDEALSNVIKHGYDRDPCGRIWVEIEPMEDKGVVEAIRITIEDCARQVDVECIRSRDLDDVRPGGLGVHIIRHLMDSAVWEKRSEGGMRLTLIKHKNTNHQTIIDPRKGEVT